MQPEYAFRLLLKLHDTWSFHLYALFLLQPAAANLIFVARPHSAPFYCNFCSLLIFLLHSNFGEVYSRFLHKNQSFYIKSNQKNGLKIDDF